MDAITLLEAYDAQLREDAEVARATDVVSCPPLLWAVFGETGMVTYRNLAGAQGHDLDMMIAASVAHFRDGTDVRQVEWKTRGHDRPESLPEHLVDHGFQPHAQETVMVGPATDLAGPIALPEGVTIRRVDAGPRLRQDVARALALQAAVFGQGAPDPQELAQQLVGDPGHLQLWVAEAGGEVIGAGRLDVVRGTQFAGLWGGAVATSSRGQGIYRALVSARARAALEHGARYLHSDCTAMSRPILERSGLAPVTTTTPYIWVRPPIAVP